MKILAFPGSRENPYQDLLYTELRKKGVTVHMLYPITGSATINVALFVPRIIWYRLHGYTIFHMHWPHALALRGPWMLQPFDKLPYLYYKFCLGVIVWLGYKLVWTAHNVLPHEPAFRDDVAARQVLVRRAALVIAHSERTLEGLHELGIVAQNSIVIPHGSYVGVYPHTISITDARRKLRLESEDFVYLYMGQIRAYKGVGALLDAFEQVRTPHTKLIVAGKCLEPDLHARLQEAHAQGTIIFRDGHVPNDDLQIYFTAADVVVLPFSAVTTSGSALLALSFGRAVIVPQLGDLQNLPDTVAYLYPPQEPNALVENMQRVGHAVDELNQKNVAAKKYADGLAWPVIAEKTFEALRRL